MTDAASREAVERLHAAILEAWNRQDADGYASFFTVDAIVVGFDGSVMLGGVEIASQLASVFADHRVARYVRIVRGVRGLSADAVLLHAVVGMVPPGGDDVMEERNAVQILVAVREGKGWRARSLQNTPAQMDGRPEARESLTNELRAVLGQAV